MTNTMLASLFALMSVAVVPDRAAPATDDAKPARAERGKHHKKKKLCKKLECTDDQKAAIKAARSAHKEAVADERNELRRLKAAMQTERGSPSPDEAKLADMKEKAKALRAEIRESREAKRAAIDAVLTPEQRKQVAEMRAEHQANKKARKAARKGDRKEARKGERKGNRDKARTRGKGKRRGEAKANRRGARRNR